MGGPEDETPVEENSNEARIAEIKKKVRIHRLEMPPTMKDEALDVVVTAICKSSIEKDIATIIKKHFDEKHEPTWHCVAGKSFGCSVCYDTQFLLFFQVEQMFILLFKSTE